MSCPCVITPGCKLHSNPFIEPGPTSQGPPLEEAPESIRFGVGIQSAGRIFTNIQQVNAQTARQMDIVPVAVKPYSNNLPMWRCHCTYDEAVSGVEPNLYQVWLSARQHFYHNHADKSL